MVKLFVASVVWFLTVAGALAAAPIEFHVATQGKDDNNGTAAAPFATLVRAQRAVREAKQNGKLAGPVNVIVHTGLYRLDKPLTFGPEDSGSADTPITYQAAPGERVMVSGGQGISGWKKLNDQLWTAELPDVKAGAWNFRQLFVGGQSRPRARLPKQGFFRVAKQIFDSPLPNGGKGPAPYTTGSRQFEFAPGDLKPNWTNIQDAEVIVYHFWTDTHLPVQAIDGEKNVISFTHKSGKVFTDDYTKGGARYVIENVFEALSEPGEWYLNRKTGTLYYWPKPGEDMATVKVVAPRLPAIVKLQGDPERQKFVEHLTFRRLGFGYARFELPAGDVNNAQASATVPSAIKLWGAKNCTFENCEICNIGMYAIDISSGCRGNAFVGNDLHNLAAGGFRVNGGEAHSHPLLRTADNVISDNLVHHYGEIFPSAVGVLLMNTEGNSVVHNHIHHGYYTGISIGWVWGYTRSVSRDNRIEFNNIHDIGQGLLSDMGGIYTLGVSPGTTIRNNIIHDVDANQYGGWGIYHDEGSTHILVENNVVYNTKFTPFFIHYAKECTVRNNVFALGRLDQLGRGQVEPHSSVYFEGNIVYWKTGKLFSSNWKDVPYDFYVNPQSKTKPAKLTSTFSIDWNLYFNPTLKRDEVKFDGGTWAEWQKRGKDLHSQYADPRFVDAEHYDFRLKPDSPAWALGFRPIDLSQVGPRRPVGVGGNAR